MSNTPWHMIAVLARGRGPIAAAISSRVLIFASMECRIGCPSVCRAEPSERRSGSVLRTEGRRLHGLYVEIAHVVERVGDLARTEGRAQVLHGVLDGAAWAEPELPRDL